MGKPFCCEGDATTHGGKVVVVSGSFTIDGRRVARVGDMVMCPVHGMNPLTEGDGQTLDEQIALTLHGHHSACGSAVICTVNATVAN